MKIKTAKTKVRAVFCSLKSWCMTGLCSQGKFSGGVSMAHFIISNGPSQKLLSSHFFATRHNSPKIYFVAEFKHGKLSGNHRFYMKIKKLIKLDDNSFAFTGVINQNSPLGKTFPKVTGQYNPYMKAGTFSVSA